MLYLPLAAGECPQKRQQNLFGAPPGTDPSEGVSGDLQEFQGLAVAHQLVDKASEFALQHAHCGALPLSRVGVMDDMLKMGEPGRRYCWKNDVAVFDTGAECAEWVAALPAWAERGDEAAQQNAAGSGSSAEEGEGETSASDADDQPEEPAGRLRPGAHVDVPCR